MVLLITLENFLSVSKDYPASNAMLTGLPVFFKAVPRNGC